MTQIADLNPPNPLGKICWLQIYRIWIPLTPLERGKSSSYKKILILNYVLRTRYANGFLLFTFLQ